MLFMLLHSRRFLQTGAIYCAKLSGSGSMQATANSAQCLQPHIAAQQGQNKQACASAIANVSRKHVKPQVGEPGTLPATCEAVRCVKGKGRSSQPS
jgi:hypothetical protein